VDINMPGEDGLSLARHLRERHAGIAIVMLTSAATVVDRIVGLEMGADDYVPKPFDPRELVARVKSVLRRTSSARDADLGAEKVRIGRCTLDLAAHRSRTRRERWRSLAGVRSLKACGTRTEPSARTHPEPQPAPGLTLTSVDPSRGCARRSSRSQH
jgi:response regulator RpfG family c-di-GMP phosphodiesterase